MSKLTPQADTVELEIVYTPEHIQRELEHWTANLAKAKADGDILATTTALAFLDTWLDRRLNQRGR